jgi:hypothetical protein
VKVKLQEVIDALQLAWEVIFDTDHMEAINNLSIRIQQHGIEVPYTPMTEIDIYRIKDSFQYATSGELGKIAIVEQAVLARLGVAPSLDHSSTVSDVTERLVTTTEREEAMNAERLRKAKQICEQSGFAVVPKDTAERDALAARIGGYKYKEYNETLWRLLEDIRVYLAREDK